MERMDDNRPALAACETRSQTPDRSRFRGVRVDDRWALPTDEPGEPQGRDEITQRRDLAAELGDRDDVNVEVARDERHRTLATSKRPGDERRLVATFA